MIIEFVFFGLSVFAIIGLFSLIAYEDRRGNRIAPAFRSRLDADALRLKDALTSSRYEISKLPHILSALARFAVHETALGAAALARLTEREAHRIADLVSHKRGFERRETQNEFLKQVSELKNGTDDTTANS